MQVLYYVAMHPKIKQTSWNRTPPLQLFRPFHWCFFRSVRFSATHKKNPVEESSVRSLAHASLYSS